MTGKSESEEEVLRLCLHVKSEFKWGEDNHQASQCSRRMLTRTHIYTHTHKHTHLKVPPSLPHESTRSPSSLYSCFFLYPSLLLAMINGLISAPWCLLFPWDREGAAIYNRIIYSAINTLTAGHKHVPCSDFRSFVLISAHVLGWLQNILPCHRRAAVIH